MRKLVRNITVLGLLCSLALTVALVWPRRQVLAFRGFPVGESRPVALDWEASVLSEANGEQRLDVVRAIRVLRDPEIVGPALRRGGCGRRDGRAGSSGPRRLRSIGPAPDVRVVSRFRLHGHGRLPASRPGLPAMAADVPTVRLTRPGCQFCVDQGPPSYPSRKD